MSKGRVLLVEDDPVTRRLANGLLLSTGAEVESRSDGLAGWEAYERGLSDRPFDLIVSDIQMPRLNGIELLARVRERDAEVAVLMVSCHESVENLRACIRLHADGFLDKPFHPRELMAQAEGLVSVGRQRRIEREARDTIRTDHAERMLAGCPDCADLAVRGIPYMTVGGDAFRCWHLDERHRLILLTDVAGHDGASSHVSAQFMGAMELMIESTREPAALLERLNHHLREHEQSFGRRFICATVGLRDLHAETLTVGVAGMQPAQLLLADGTRRAVGSTASPLGLFDSGEWTQETVPLPMGCTIVLATDGVTELRDGEGGVHPTRLLDLVRDELGRHGDLETTADRALAATLEWSDGPPSDDLTIVLLSGPRVGSDDASTCLGSSYGEVDRGIAWLEAWLAKEPLAPVDDRARDVRAAVREALMNAASHGNGFDSDKTVRLDLSPRPDRLLVRISDEGEGVPWPRDARLPDELPQGGGLGQPLIARLADTVIARGSTLELTFLIPSEVTAS
ncbi:MAG: fused response regulator/phosphatase [Acidobacteriota bacterium]